MPVRLCQRRWLTTTHHRGYRWSLFTWITCAVSAGDDASSLKLLYDLWGILRGTYRGRVTVTVVLLDCLVGFGFVESTSFGD